MMIKSIEQSRRWLQAAGIAGVMMLAACGGGGDTNTDTSSGSGTDEVAQTDGAMPENALVSDNSFLAWVKSFSGAPDESGEPVKVMRGDPNGRDSIGLDETSEPQLLR